MALYIGNTRYCPVLQEKESLPYDAEVEYIESTGTQYINTGLIATYSDKFGAELAYKLNTYGRHSNGTGYICGAGGATDGFCLRVQFTTLSAVIFGATYGAAYNYSNISVSQDSMVYHSNKYGVEVLSVESSNSLATISKSDTGFLSLPVILFGENRTNGVFTDALIGAKMYSARFFHDYTVIMELIPVRVGTTGYMYDKVSKTLFGNSGTGNFTLGPDKT
jgi:hypothetical protein